MPQFLVQDSDWALDNAEFPAVEVSASDPVEATRLAVDVMHEMGECFDGCHFSVHIIDSFGPQLCGWIGWTRDEGFDAEFHHFGNTTWNS